MQKNQLKVHSILDENLRSDYQESKEKTILQKDSAPRSSHYLLVYSSHLWRSVHEAAKYMHIISSID